MKKIESIWHYLLTQTLEDKVFKFTQQQIAGEFGYSLSTVNLAVKKLEQIGAISILPRWFTVLDAKKILYFWATHRHLEKDIIYRTRIDQPIKEIEGCLPPQAIFAAYSAAAHLLAEPPADYSQVYFYLQPDYLPEVKQRFPLTETKQPANVIVLKSGLNQERFGAVTTLAQTFVDIWSLKDWYAKDFIEVLERRIDELLP